MAEINEMTIEEAFKALDEILEDLDSDQNVLEDTFSNSQMGLEVVKLLENKIEGIEKKLNVLESENGEENV